jgi:hypothetical protein
MLGEINEKVEIEPRYGIIAYASKWEEHNFEVDPRIYGIAQKSNLNAAFMPLGRNLNILNHYKDIEMARDDCNKIIKLDKEGFYAICPVYSGEAFVFNGSQINAIRNALIREYGLANRIHINDIHIKGGRWVYKARTYNEFGKFTLDGKTFLNKPHITGVTIFLKVLGTACDIPRIEL